MNKWKIAEHIKRNIVAISKSQGEEMQKVAVNRLQWNNNVCTVRSQLHKHSHEQHTHVTEAKAMSHFVTSDVA